MDTVTLVGRLLVSLAAVLGLMWVIARRMRKSVTGRSGGLVDVLGRRQLSRTASVAVVRVLDQALIVGITDAQVSLIGETDLAAATAAAEVPATRRPAPRPRPQRAPALDLTSKLGGDGRILVPTPAGAQARAPRTPNAALGRPRRNGAAAGSALAGSASAGSALAGSALSPATWRQAVDSLRSLTARNN